MSSTHARTTSPRSWRRASRPTDSAITRMASFGSMKQRGIGARLGWSGRCGREGTRGRGRHRGAVGRLRDDGVVGLTLITGPANAGKARLVLDGLRERAAEDPILVVPTPRDAEAYRLELAESGATFGPRVTWFSGLAREVALRVGLDGGRLRPAQRERVVAAAVEDAGLRELAAAAGAPGFRAAAGRLIAELQRERVTPGRLASALGKAAGDDPAPAEEVAAIYAAYRRRLERLGRRDDELLAWQALDALRAAPERWGGTPV